MSEFEWAVSSGFTVLVILKIFDHVENVKSNKLANASLGRIATYLNEYTFFIKSNKMTELKRYRSLGTPEQIVDHITDLNDQVETLGAALASDNKKLPH